MFLLVRHPTPVLIVPLIALTACDSSPEPADSGPGDAGRDAFVPMDSASDAGTLPPGELRREWVDTVFSEATLATPEARVGLAPDGMFTLSMTLGGAAATFAPGAPQETVVGAAADAPVTQAAAWYRLADGQLDEARALVSAAPSAEGFSALGYGVATLTDGSAIFGGRFRSGALFGEGGTGAQTLTTLRGEVEETGEVFYSEEAYLLRLDDTRRLDWVARSVTEHPLARHRIADVAVLPDGSSLVVGSFNDAMRLGVGTDTEVRHEYRLGLDGGEAFIARYGPDGDFEWSRRVYGWSEPRRIWARADGSFVIALRYAEAITLGRDEDNERTLDPPPEGVLVNDVVASFESDGSFAWAHPMVADATTYPGIKEVISFDDGSLLVAGTFRGELTHPDAPELDTLTLWGNEGVLLRLEPDGAVRWRRRIRPLRSLVVQAVTEGIEEGFWVLATIDGGGGTFLLGEDETPYLVDRAQPEFRVLAFRYDALGVLQSVQILGANELDADDALFVGPDRLIVVGRYGEGAVVDYRMADQVTLPPAGAFRNAFIASYRVELP